MWEGRRYSASQQGLARRRSEFLAQGWTPEALDLVVDEDPCHGILQSGCAEQAGVAAFRLHNCLVLTQFCCPAVAVEQPASRDCGVDVSLAGISTSRPEGDGSQSVLCNRLLVNWIDKGIFF